MENSKKVKRVTELIVANLVKKLLIQHRKPAKLEVIKEEISNYIQSLVDILAKEQKDELTTQHEAEIKQLKGILVNPKELTVGQRIKLLFTGEV